MDVCCGRHGFGKMPRREFPVLATGGDRGTPRREKKNTAFENTPHWMYLSTSRDSPNPPIYRTSCHHLTHSFHPPRHGHRPSLLLATLRTLATPSPSRLLSSTQASASHSFRKKNSRLNYFIYKISPTSLSFDFLIGLDVTRFLVLITPHLFKYASANCSNRATIINSSRKPCSRLFMAGQERLCCI